MDDFTKKEIIESLKKVHGGETPFRRNAMMQFLKIQKAANNDLEFCREYLCFVMNSILKSCGDNERFIDFLIQLGYFGNHFVLERVIDFCQKTNNEKLFKLINNEYQYGQVEPLVMLEKVFDKLDFSHKAKAISVQLYNAEKYEDSKNWIMKLRTDRFEKLDTKYSGYEEVFEILAEVRCFLNGQEFVGFILNRIDHILNKDAVFSTRYALTLLESCCKTLQITRIKIPKIINPMLEYLKIQINKDNPEFEKLNIALEIVHYFVHFNSFDYKSISQKLTIINKNPVNKVLLERRKDLTSRLLYYITYFWGTSSRSTRFRKKKESRIVNERETKRLLEENAKLSYAIQINEIAMENDLMEKMEKLIKLCSLTDSFYHQQLHAEILRCFIQILNENRVEFEALSNSLIRDGFDIFEFFTNCMEASSDFGSLKIIAQLLPLQYIDVEEKEFTIIDVCTVFLEKLKVITFGEALELSEILIEVNEDMILAAGDHAYNEPRMIEPSKIGECVSTLEKLRLFVNRDIFVDYLLNRSHYLLNSPSEFQERFALTMAQCGYDENNKYQVDPSKDYKRAEIVEDIYLYLSRAFGPSKNERNLEIPVQIFKNFVKIKHDSWFIIDTKEIEQSLIDWYSRFDRKTNMYTVRLKNKIGDLFKTNLRYCEQPSFGSRFEVVSKDRLKRFLKCKRDQQYFTDHNP